MNLYWVIIDLPFFDEEVFVFIGDFYFLSIVN